MHILILDTPSGELRELADAFCAAEGEPSSVEVARTVTEVLARIRTADGPDLVVVDHLLGDGSARGADVIAAIRAADGGIPIAATAERGDVSLAAEVVRSGAVDLLVRGADLERRVATLLSKVRNLLELRERNALLDEQNRLLRETYGLDLEIVGESPSMLEVFRRVRRVAKIPRPVLILGERGTGKELVARAIHSASDRANGPFVVVNCAAFPDALLESELFGHEKGAFTGAESRARGKFELARRGTLFLDEVAHMSLPFQQKILRAVEYGTFTRVGGDAEISSDARIVAATNADLRRRIAEGRFLPDLHDRLAFEEIAVPPLRERAGDIEVLARHFLERFAREVSSIGQKRLSPDAVKALGRHDFPGNVRELKNIIERGAYRDAAEEISAVDLGIPAAPPADATRSGDFESEVEAFKRRLIQDALARSGGNGAAAARALGLSYDQFRYYLRKLGAGQ